MADENKIADYDLIYRLTLQYQQGDSSAAQEVLAKFDNYLTGFLILIRGGSVKKVSYSHRLFLAAFMKNPNLGRSLRSSKPVGAAYIAAEAVVTTISIQLRPIDQDDLVQEIYEVFLGTLRRYKSRDNQNFLIPYIYKAFPYALVRKVKSLIKDPLVNLASDKILSLESINDFASHDDSMNNTIGQRISSKDIKQHLTVTYNKTLEETEVDQLGNQWIAGDVCDDALDMLTPLERRFIKDFYFMQKTDAQIAEYFGVSYNTAVRRRYLIENKIRGLYIAPTCKWCNIEISKTSVGRQPRQCEDCKKEHRNKKNKLVTI